MCLFASHLKVSSLWLSGIFSARRQSAETAQYVDPPLDLDEHDPIVSGAV